MADYQRGDGIPFLNDGAALFRKPKQRAEKGVDARTEIQRLHKKKCDLMGKHQRLLSQFSTKAIKSGRAVELENLETQIADTEREMDELRASVKGMGDWLDAKVAPVSEGRTLRSARQDAGWDWMLRAGTLEREGREMGENRERGRDGVLAWKHLGPGNHPDGSPQSVHGGGRGAGGASNQTNRANGAAGGNMSQANHPLNKNKWNMYAGGTAAAEGKHSYDVRGDFGLYSVDPISTSSGRHLGYRVKFANEKGKLSGRGLWSELDENGEMQSYGSFRGKLFNSPQSAMGAAKRHYDKYFGGK